MARRKEAFNPFYALLVVVGVAFALTAFAYGVMALRAVDPRAVAAEGSGATLLEFLDHWGVTLMMGELVVLAAATFGAISTDGYWARRARRRQLHGDARDD